MGINGIPTPTFESTPLALYSPDGRYIAHHTFRIIPDCPVDLLGRDLFEKLRLCLSFAENGLQVESDVTSIVSPLFMNLTLTNLPPELRDVDVKLWSNGDFDTGFIDCTPYRATLKPNTLSVYQKQYPLSRKKLDGLRPMVERFLRDGVLVEICSPYCTPINPVAKAEGQVRFVQDLRAINDLIVPIAPIVPDVTSLLSAIPAQAKYFSVIDLKNAFFSIPVDKDTRPLFAFSFEGRQLSWNRMPQGFVDSPVVYSIVLQATLKPWHAPQSSVLLQYVDDILVCSLSEEDCRTDCLSLLKWLCVCGHKVSLKKMQWCKKEVEYLGFVLTEGEKKDQSSQGPVYCGLGAPTNPEGNVVLPGNDQLLQTMDP